MYLIQYRAKKENKNCIKSQLRENKTSHSYDRVDVLVWRFLAGYMQ